jgi:FkbM family methyltransferase
MLKLFEKGVGKAKVKLMQFSEYFLKRNGFDIIPTYYVKHPILLRLEHIANGRYDVVIDVGANIGQFAQEIRYHGYSKRIISFEPILECFNQLSIKAEDDPLWDIFPKALGEKNEELEIHISENQHSSSILKIQTAHLDAEPRSISHQSQMIAVVRLDEVYSDLTSSSDKVFLKIDTQGYELKVLTGADKCLQYISAIQVEMSMKELYEQQPLFHEIYQYLTDRNFKLISLEPSFIDPRSSELLQVDGFFVQDTLI